MENSDKIKLPEFVIKHTTDESLMYVKENGVIDKSIYGGYDGPHYLILKETLHNTGELDRDFKGCWKLDSFNFYINDWVYCDGEWIEIDKERKRLENSVRLPSFISNQMKEEINKYGKHLDIIPNKTEEDYIGDSYSLELVEVEGSPNEFQWVLTSLYDFIGFKFIDGEWVEFEIPEDEM